jgi:hypothetical protein
MAKRSDGLPAQLQDINGDGPAGSAVCPNFVGHAHIFFRNEVGRLPDVKKMLALPSSRLDENEAPRVVAD